MTSHWEPLHIITMIKNVEQVKNLSKINLIKLALVGVLVVIIISIAILACVPPVSRDALTHHLAIPNLYLKHGGIYEIPHVKFSYYPMNLDLLYMIPLYFGNDILPKYIHFAFALLTALLIFRYLRSRLDDVYAVLGAVLFLSLPITVKLSTTVYVDLGLIFFSTAALLYLFKWMNHNYRFNHLLIAAIWCGLALGTKYNGLILFFLLTIFVVLIYVKAPDGPVNKQSKAIGFGLAFMLIAAIVFSPWTIKNTIWTRNPIYPLYNSWFNRQNTAPAAAVAENSLAGKTAEANAAPKKAKGGWSSFAARKVIFNERGWEIALIPIRIFFQGEDDNPKYFDGRLNPLLFFLPVIAFFNFRSDSVKLRREKSILLLFSILYILFTFFHIDMRIRYIAPVIPPLVILSLMGLHTAVTFIQGRLAGAKQRLAYGSLMAAVSLLLLLNAQYLVDQFQYVDPMSYLSGKLQRDDYIARYRGEYPAIQFINSHLPSNAKLLALGLGNRIYYCDRSLVCDPEFFRNALAASRSADSLADALRSRGYTHVLIRKLYFQTFIYNHMADNKRMIWAHFLKTRTELLFEENGHQLLKILDAGTVHKAQYKN